MKEGGEKGSKFYLAATGPLFAHVAAIMTQCRWLRGDIASSCTYLSNVEVEMRSSHYLRASRSPVPFVPINPGWRTLGDYSTIAGAYVRGSRAVTSCGISLHHTGRHDDV